MAANRSARLVAVEGLSAAGKSTVVRRLARGGEWVALPEAFATVRPRLSLRFDSPGMLLSIERRLLQAERRRAQAAQRLLRGGRSVLLDTAPFGPATYSAGVARLDARYRRAAQAMVARVAADLDAGRIVPPQRVVYLDASERTRRLRSRSSPTTHPARLAARHRAVGRVEREFWVALARSDPRSVRFVRAGGSAAAVADRVAGALARPAPALRRATVLRALRTLAERLEGPRNGIVKKGTSSRRPPRR